MELFAKVTLGAKCHQVKVCSWAAGGIITDGIKNGLGRRHKARTERGKTERGNISDLPCGNGSLYARPKAYFPDEYVC